MTIEWVREQVAAVQAEAEKRDHEVAHVTEDGMHQLVLREVALTAPEPWRSLAAEALKTLEIHFERWCA